MDFGPTPGNQYNDRAHIFVFDDGVTTASYHMKTPRIGGAATYDFRPIAGAEFVFTFASGAGAFRASCHEMH